MPVNNPLRCSFSAMAQRGAGNVVLLNTGNYPGQADFLNITNTWQGSIWSGSMTATIDPAGPLPLRSETTMAYDGTNVIMFGGKGESETVGLLGDTWSWNGTAWSSVSGTAPFARYGHKMAYLAGTGAIMFGGSNVLNYLNETWQYVSGVWTQLAPASSPPARIGHAMAGGGGMVVMFGGQNSNQCLNDTYNFNGTTWTKNTSPTTPSVRTDAVMAYDTSANNFVLFGGANENGLLPTAETWTYQSGVWTQMSPTVSPPSMVGAQMCYDSQTGAVLLFGGAGSTDAFNETWKWSAGQWTKL